MSHIGEWVRRPRRGRSRWHLVETEIEEDMVTRCGRRLKSLDFRGRGLAWATNTIFEENCKYCT